MKTLLTRRTALAVIAGVIATRNAFATPEQTKDWLAAQARSLCR